MTSEVSIFVTNKSLPGSSFRDGDIVSAFSDRQISQDAAQRRCTDLTLFDSNGLRMDGCLLDRYLACMMQYKFERVTRNEVVRHDLWTGQRQMFGPRARSGQTEAMDVRRHVKIMTARPTHKVFGKPGLEYWYGGRTGTSPDFTARVWDMIEGLTSSRRTDYENTIWNRTERELCERLVMTFESTDDDVVERLINHEIDYDEFQPEYDPKHPTDPKGNQCVQKRRFNKADWRDIPGVNPDDVFNRSVGLDLRSTVGLYYSDVFCRPRENFWSVRDHLEGGGPPIG